MRRLLVTGTGRSGTAYTAALLSACGLKCGHEAVFNLRLHAFEGELAESSWLAAPFVRDLGPETVVVHQLRNPHAVVQSYRGVETFSTNQETGLPAAIARSSWALRRRIARRRVPALVPRGAYGRFIAEHTPDVFDLPTEEERAAEHWLSWNRMIAEGSRETGATYIRIEISTASRATWESIFDAVDFSPAVSVDSVLSSVPRDTNSRPHERHAALSPRVAGRLTSAFEEALEDASRWPDVSVASR